MNSEVHNFVWNDWFWLPTNVTWDDIQKIRSDGKLRYPKATDLLYPVLFGVGIVFLRVLTERTLLTKVGNYFGLDGRPVRRIPPNPELESRYQQIVKVSGNKRFSTSQIQQLATQCDLSTRQVERWLRKRSHKSRTNLDKFKESGWRAICYGSLWILAALSMVNKSWTWNIVECWDKDLNLHVDLEIWWYYMLQMSLYWSFFVTQFFDQKRKDFWIMCAHHVVVLVLLSFSWITNLVRMGSLMTFLHDTADVPLEMSKILAYIHLPKASNCMGGVFAVIWFVTRLFLFPKYLMRSTMFETLDIFGSCPMYYILNLMLVFLLTMHLIWSYYIVKYLYCTITLQKCQDSRSSTEEDDEDDNDTGTANGKKDQ